MLENIELKTSLSQEEYQEEYPQLKQRLSSLQNACAAQGIPVVILFEGWDAAGANAAIEALSSCFDPHGYTAYSIGEPNGQDRLYPWMRRFWLIVPHYGAIAIFDRSWYRRVLDDLVQFWERLPALGHIAFFDGSWYTRVLAENFRGLWLPEEQERAYREINAFERQLVDFGTIIFKFWLLPGRMSCSGASKKANRRSTNSGQTPTRIGSTPGAGVTTRRRSTIFC